MNGKAGAQDMLNKLLSDEKLMALLQQKSNPDAGEGTE
jgi:hypothetical protein